MLRPVVKTGLVGFDAHERGLIFLLRWMLKYHGCFDVFGEVVHIYLFPARGTCGLKATDFTMSGNHCQIYVYLYILFFVGELIQVLLFYCASTVPCDV